MVDQTRAFSKAGENINVNPNGVRALRLFAPELADKLCAPARGRRSSAFKFTDPNGVPRLCCIPGETDPFDSGQHTKEDEPNVGSSWDLVQKLLLEGVPDDVVMRTNTQFVALRDENDDDGCAVGEFIVDRIRANPFAHWENDPAAAAARGEADNDNSNGGQPTSLSLRGRVVIGADGINSRLRNTPTQYSGFVSFKSTGSGPAPGTPAGDAAAQVEKRYFDGQVFCMVGCHRERAAQPDASNVMLVRLSGAAAERLGFEWKVIVHAAVAEEHAQDPYDAVMKELRDSGYPPELIILATHMLVPGEGRKVIARPLYVVPISEPPPYERANTASAPGDAAVPFGAGRVILAGDSLHGMPPFISQGTSMGWEDVVELVDLLAKECRWGEADENKSPSIEALEKLREVYREARTERIAVAQRETLMRRWGWDETGFAVQQLWLRDFKPRADGW